MSDEIYREDGESFRSVRVGLRDDALVVDTHDMGPTTEVVWGDGDYEFWTKVGREHWGDLAVALVKELLGGRADATDRLEAICQRHDIPFERGSWS